MSCEVKQSVQQTYVETQSAGAVTEPENGNWLQGYCEFLGVTEPVNSSWLQALCIHLGITEPLYASWTIALANYYGITAPVNGSWWWAIACADTPITDLIWDLTSTEWQLENADWKTVAAPSAPTFDQEGSLINASPLPTFSGTATATNQITLTINNDTYYTTTDNAGVWSLTVTNTIPGGVGAGQNYAVDIIALDQGIPSATTVGSVNILVAQSTIRFELETGWSLYWYYTAVQVEKETSPGVWAAIEYEGNPTWNSGSTFYKVQPTESVVPWPVGYDPKNAMSFGQGDQFAVQGQVSPREIILDQGYTYRIVSIGANATNYGRFSEYTVYDGATVVLPLYTTGADNNWVTGYVQQTFTL
jgi:hypothetical protein